MKINRLTLWATALACFTGEGAKLNASQLKGSLQDNGISLDSFEMERLITDLKSAGLVEWDMQGDPGLCLTARGVHCRTDANTVTSAIGSANTLLACTEREFGGDRGNGSADMIYS